MQVLLLSMPDSFEHTSTDHDADAERRARVAGRQRRSAPPRRRRRPRSSRRGACAQTVERLVRELEPDVVGLSVMTFQRRTARRIAALVRALRPAAHDRRRRLRSEPRAGGLRGPGLGVDVIVRGEGDITFRELLRALEAGAPLSTGVAGLSYRDGDGFRAQSGPRRSARFRATRCGCRTAPRACSTGYTFLGRPIDVVETSRGCTFDCSFCSIIEMRGRNFHTWSIERVLADIADARARGARAIFIVDDNITLDVAALRGAVPGDHRGRLQRHRLHRAGDDVVDRRRTATTLAPLMREAGFRYVFLGIENVLEDDLAFLKAQREERARARAAARSATRRSTAIDLLHRHGMFVVGGLIVGNPGRHARVDRGQPRVRARATSTGPTSSTRRRIRARR